MDAFNIKKLKYDLDQIIGKFNLKVSNSCEILTNWINVNVPKDYSLSSTIEKKRVRLQREGSLWNEEELKMHFLSFVFSEADFDEIDKIKLFYERPLSGVVNDTPLNVVCDALLASPYGINTPKKPYFFLQEFKKGKKASDDAEGQMLIAMLIAQQQNGDGNPVYGCWLMGKDWNFTTLHGQNYCFSKSYDATDPKELAEIIFILQNIKKVIKY